MGNRLSKIYTRTGDDGTTGLGNGERAAKNDTRVEAYGTVDELNSTIGMVLATAVSAEITECLEQVQQDLFDLGGELCIPDTEVIDADRVARLEQQLDQLNADLPPLKEFILPGGGAAAAACHLARAVCRRAERRTCSLADNSPVNTHTLQYLNRLSDLLFVIARVMSRHAGADEVLWQSSKAQNR
jgi:cob(I)alamin adenosyltransferase